MYITEPCVAFGLMAKSRKEASREKINIQILYKANPNTPPPPKKKKMKERKERKGKKKKSSSRNQTPHILFVGKLVTDMPLMDEQPICK